MCSQENNAWVQVSIQICSPPCMGCGNYPRLGKPARHPAKQANLRGCTACTHVISATPTRTYCVILIPGYLYGRNRRTFDLWSLWKFPQLLRCVTSTRTTQSQCRRNDGRIFSLDLGSNMAGKLSLFPEVRAGSTSLARYGLANLKAGPSLQLVAH
jgi:hypothetical protein